MKTIFLFEWKNLLRNPLSIIMLFFFVGIGIYSIQYGNKVLKKQLVVIDSLRKTYKAQIVSSIKKFHADTTTIKGKRDYNNVAKPSSVNYLIKPVAIFNPNSFSALAIGQRDVLPFYKEVSSERSFTQAYPSEISNPEVLAMGNFDLSFIIVNLLPLLMIASSYNTLSQEKEQGTYRLLMLQSNYPQKLIFYKLLFKVLIVLSLTYGLNCYAIYVTGKTIPVNNLEVFTWFLVSTSYLVFWSAVCYLLISLQKSSATTAFYMVGCWIFLVVLLPSILNFYVNGTYPIGIKADMASEQRKIEEDVWGIKPKTLIENFYKHHPLYKTGNLADTMQYSPRRFVAYYNEMERRLLPISNVYDNKIKYRSHLLSQLSAFLPSLTTQQMLNQIAHSDLQAFRDFDRSSYLFHKKWQAMIYHFIFNDKQFRQEDYLSFPIYRSDAIPYNSKSILLGIFHLTILSIVLIAFAIFKNKQIK
ncbi:ABC-2 type transport system permease protein [Pedobacter sp. CG_S7]|uniref:DUF3526 domain-containing protein n=1 Tax=Pedobacter sp. CG_S7 TaxID=3143930 RepID=UPI0033952C14